MAKYLLSANYSVEGTKGLLKEGGTGRRSAIETLSSSVGASLDAFYYAFGGDDAYLIVDAPTPEAAAAVSLVVAAGGGATCETTVLLTPEQIDAAKALAPQYRAPGG